MPAPLLALALTAASPGAPASAVNEPRSHGLDTGAQTRSPADSPIATAPTGSNAAAHEPTSTAPATGPTDSSPSAPPTSAATRTTPPPADSPAPTTPPGAPTTSPAATAPSSAAAPTPARPRWWGPDPRPKVSGYGGPALRLAGLHGQFAAFVGAEGGINILQRISIGASLQWLLNPVEAGAFAVGGATRLNLNFGGLVVDVAYIRGKRVAGTLGGLLGGGGGCLQNPENGDCADRTAFFVGEPRAGLRVTLAPIVRLHLALGYRLVAARAWAGPRDLGGPAGTVALEFGWF